MESDQELHLLANKARNTSPSGSTDLPPVAIKSFFSKWLSLLKHHAGTVQARYFSLYNLVCLIHSTWITNWWTLEILSWFSAAWALGMIVLTLGLLHDKPLPQWPSGITVNSLISVLSQIGQWGLMGSVAKALGQLKWVWFRRSKRPLMDFVAFDEASKGPRGSLLLLMKGRFVHWVLLGALIVIATQAFQPFVQQAVTYPIRLQQSGISTCTRGVAFHEVDGLPPNINQTYLINPMKASIYNGLYSPNVTLSDVSASCQSGNCTWPVYSSLAICASTADVSASLTSSCSTLDPKQCNYSLPSGGSLAGKNDIMSISTTDNTAFTPLAFATTNPVIDFFTFLISNKTSQPLLLESALHLCVQSYNTSVINGRTETRELTSWTQLNITQDYVVEVPNDPAKYVMGYYSFNTMTAFLKSILQGRYEIKDDTPIYGSDAIEVLVDKLLVEPYDEAAMMSFLNGLATSMTNTLRTGLWSETVNGTSYSLVSYVRVDWLWLVLPATLILLSFPFLIATIVQSSQAKIKPWKTSALATLQGLGNELRNELGALDAEATMERGAGTRFAQLKEGDNGWRLV